jgi:hypothetical protein
MKGKEAVPVSKLTKLQATDPAKHYVVIAVCCHSPQLQDDRHEETSYAKVTLTDVAKEQPARANLLLTGRALETFLPNDGTASPIKAGVIVGLLNPIPTRRHNTLRVDHATQVQILGLCPSLGLCRYAGSGHRCHLPFNTEVATSCLLHAGYDDGIPAKRQRQGVDRVASPARTSTSRKLALFEEVHARLLEASDPNVLLQELTTLEMAEVCKITLNLTAKLQQRVAELASSNHENVGAKARQVRRKWRAVLAEP